MKQLLRLILAMCLALLVPATALAQRHQVQVGDFTHLTVIDDINVVYRCMPDSAGMAVVDCPQRVADNLIFSLNKKGRLSIQVTTDMALQCDAQLPTITVYSKQLDEAENAGDSTLTVYQPATTDGNFKARLSDNGKIIVHGLKAVEACLDILTGRGTIVADGQCDKVKLKLMGSGSIVADQVTATNVDCHIIGTGTINCNVNGGKLYVRGSGTGKVYYKGEPGKVTVRKLGTIKAIPMDQKQ